MKAKQRYNEKNYERVFLTIPKGTKSIIQNAAKNRGMSMNQYITSLVFRDIHENTSFAEKVYADDFEIFKSNVCHQLKASGDKNFVLNVLQEDTITTFYKGEMYREAFYLLAMVDYLSRENGYPICSDYNGLRQKRLPNFVWPKSVLLADKLNGNDDMKQYACQHAIPEFFNLGIIEGDIRNVC